MMLWEAIREAKRGGDDALMVDESWTSLDRFPSGPVTAHHTPGPVSSALLRHYFANSEPDVPDEGARWRQRVDSHFDAEPAAVDEKYATPPLDSGRPEGRRLAVPIDLRGSSDDAAREQSMRETAFDESYRNHESVSVVRHPSAPVYVIRDPEDDAEVHLPAEGLPKFVRELAALMTEDQRRALLVEVAPTVNGCALLVNLKGPPEAAKRYAESADRFVTAMGGPKDEGDSDIPDRQIHLESGPGISALPVKTEPLTFLDVDLLCGDE